MLYEHKRKYDIKLSILHIKKKENKELIISVCLVYLQNIRVPHVKAPRDVPFSVLPCECLLVGAWSLRRKTVAF